MTIVCVPGVSGCKSVTQPCATDRPCVPGGRPKMLSAGRTMFSRGVSTSVTGTDLSSTVTVGATCASRAGTRPVIRRLSPPCPSNVLHSTEVAATNILVPGFTVHDATGRGPKRRNGAAEVDARKFGTAGAEGVLGARCLKDRRPQRREIVIQLLRRVGAGGGCAQAERHRNE